MNAGAPVSLVIRAAGLVTPVGWSAPASCAAFRAKLSNPTPTGFMGNNGEWITGHQVAFEQPWRGLAKLATMAARAIDETLSAVPTAASSAMPLLLCVAERDRPGRLDGLDHRLFDMIGAELGARFAPSSRLVPHGRVATAVALATARQLVVAGGATQVLVAAADTLLTGPTLAHYVRAGRLLGRGNSNGFMPGEAAGALLVEAATSDSGALRCTGIGFGHETAGIDSGEPLRGGGLSQAAKAALREAGCAMHEMDFRIGDTAGESYYFKEADLAVSRTMRVLREEFDLWHPAECIGEVGAAAGIAGIALAQAACAEGYAPGPNILLHAGNDAGPRAALVLRQPA